MKKLLPLIFLAMLSSNCFAMRIVTEAKYMKTVNGNAGFELLAKTTIPINESFDIKLGVSEGFTAPRNSAFSFNHAGTRLDIGVLWYLPWQFKVGYTHSARKWFDGASPIDIFDYDSIDTFSVRKEFAL